MTLRLATLAALLLTLSAAVCAVVLYGWRWRSSGARPGDPSWRELFVDGEAVGV